MSFKFNISDILTCFELSERERSNLARLFDYTNFLYDDETNLTKTFNLTKDAREKLMERIKEMFESDLFEEASEGEEEQSKEENDL